ncbi:MAG: carbohydrate ABC transporter substrate-binding protein [Chloroflexi bacterium]|nr:carbohydrate ABC transporter substrate-binding protein [Chloroflexota bacterium]
MQSSKRASVLLPGWVTALVSVPLVLAACSSPAAAPAATQPAAGAAAAPTSAAQPAAAPTAAAAASGEKIELRFAWWGSQDRHDRTIKVIQLFEQQHPNINITYEFAGFQDYFTKMSTYATGSNLPDLMQQDYATINQWTQNGLIVPLDDYVNDRTINLTDVPKSSIDGGRINGKLIALNLGNNSQSMMLDVDAFQKAGVPLPQDTWTWDDFEKDAMAIHSKLSIQAGGANLDDPQMWKSLFIGLGQWTYTSDNKALGYSDDSPFVSYLQRLARLQDAGAITPQQEEIANYRAGNVEALPIVKGNAAMQYLWSNQLVAAWKAAGDSRHFQLTFLPRTSADGKAENYLKPSQFISITKDSKHPKEAAMFIDFMTNDVEANKILLGERGVPISPKIQEAIAPMLTPAQAESQRYVASVEKAGSPLPPPDPIVEQNLENNIYLPQVVDPVLLKQTKPEDAVAQFRKDANSLLASS